MSVHENIIIIETPQSSCYNQITVNHIRLAAIIFRKISARQFVLKEENIYSGRRPITWVSKETERAN